MEWRSKSGFGGGVKGVEEGRKEHEGDGGTGGCWMWREEAGEGVEE